MKDFKQGCYTEFIFCVIFINCEVDIINKSADKL